MLVTYIENKYRIGKLLTIKANYGFNNNNKLQLLKLLKEQEEEREKKMKINCIWLRRNYRNGM